MAKPKRGADHGFGETTTQERPASPHCTVCGAVFGTCDHTMEKPAQLPATVAAQQIEETLHRPHGNAQLNPLAEYPPPLAAKRIALMRLIKPIAKADKNEFHKYHYASALDVCDGVRSLMLDQGLFLDQEETGKKSMNDGVLTIEYAFTWGDADGNRSPAMLWSGMCRLVDSKGTADDKAAPKAHTQARKYFLIKNLDISTPDLPDSDADGNKVPDGIKGTTRDPADDLPIEPHLIIANPGTAQNWQRLYLIAIRRCTDAVQVGAWVTANQPQLTKLKDKAAPLYDAANEAVLKRYQELAAQPAGQKPLPPRADGQPNPPSTAQSAGHQAQTTTDARSADQGRPADRPTNGQSSTSPAQSAATSTSTAATTPAAAAAASGFNQMGPMEEQTFLEGWGNMLAVSAHTIQNVESLQFNYLDKVKTRLSSMGYAKAVEMQMTRIKQIQTGHLEEDLWDFDSWFRTDFLGALSSCAEGDVERLDHVQQKVVIPARGRMTDTQWKQTAKKFREEAARIKGDEL